jgi:hypothetical protein
MQLENIAKKKYSKNDELREFQEAFYQDFMRNDKFEGYSNRIHSEKLHNRLLKMREKAI